MGQEWGVQYPDLEGQKPLENSISNLTQFLLSLNFSCLSFLWQGCWPLYLRLLFAIFKVPGIKRLPDSFLYVGLINFVPTTLLLFIIIIILIYFGFSKRDFSL